MAGTPLGTVLWPGGGSSCGAQVFLWVAAITGHRRRHLRCLVGIAVSLVSHLQTAFYLVARFESHDQLLGHEDPFASSRIPSVACCSLSDLEDPESPQFNATFRNQCSHDGVKRLLDDFFGLRRRNAGLSRNSIDNVSLGH